MASKMQSIDVRRFKGTNTIDDPISLDPAESPNPVNMDITKSGAMITRFGHEEVASIVGVTGGFRGIQPYYRTYDDSVGPTDQSDDPSGAYANTYTCPAVISETVTNLKSFTPVKTKVYQIAIWVVAKNTSDISVTLHDASNNLLAFYVIPNASLVNGQMNYFNVKYTWTSGLLHFHVTSTAGDSTIKTSVAADMSTASYIETYSTIGDYLILHHSNGNSYYVTNDNMTPTLIGQYGADNNNTVRGTTFNNYAIFGNAHPSWNVRKWNATTESDIGAKHPRGNVFGTFCKRLFIALNSRVDFSAVDDQDTWNNGSDAKEVTVNIGDGQDVNGLLNNNDFLQVYKEDSVYGINFSFDSSYNLTNPQLQNIVSTNAGAFAPGSVQPLYGYSFFLGRFGFNTYGPNPQRIVADMPVPLSMNIDPTIKNINFKYKNQINSAFYDNKYMCICPMGNSTINDTIFIYNENVKRRFGYDNWTIYQGINAWAFAVFRDNNKADQLYFVSPTEPKLYRFNNSFSDSGFGYNRIWKSKTFQFGERTKWKWIDIEGAMTQNTTIFVDINTDGLQVSDLEINSTNLVQNATGSGYIGDNYVGDEIVGGGTSAGTLTPMYKFKKRIYFPDTVNYGYNMWFQLRNIAEGEGWKLNRYRLVYEPDPDDPTYDNTTK